jgi:hypothetical protein
VQEAQKYSFFALFPHEKKVRKRVHPFEILYKLTRHLLLSTQDYSTMVYRPAYDWFFNHS